MSANKTKVINIRISEPVKKKLVAMAKKEKRSITNMLQVIIEEAVE